MEPITNPTHELVMMRCAAGHEFLIDKEKPENPANNLACCKLVASPNHFHAKCPICEEVEDCTYHE